MRIALLAVSFTVFATTIYLLIMMGIEEERENKQ